jgi:hypothetical protein
LAAHPHELWQQLRLQQRAAQIRSSKPMRQHFGLQQLLPQGSQQVGAAEQPQPPSIRSSSSLPKL